MKNYTEHQKFDQIWLKIIFGLILFFVLYDCTNRFQTINSRLYILGIYMGFLVLFYSFKLTIEISSNGISYRFFPFFYKKTMQWPDVKNIKLVKYQPIKQFAGWGYRISNEITCFSTNGNIGLLVNNSLLLGIRDPERFLYFIKQSEELSYEIKQLNFKNTISQL